MKLIERLPKFEMIPLGEFRIGCEAYGVLVRTGYGVFDFLRDIPVAIGAPTMEGIIEVSSCGEYIKISGEFDTYILRCTDLKVSVYRTTINGSVIESRDWGESGEHTEENAIYGSAKSHIQGFKKPVYLQFPFVDQNQLNKLLSDYKALRLRQIYEAVQCI